MRALRPRTSQSRSYDAARARRAPNSRIVPFLGAACRRDRRRLTTEVAGRIYQDPFGRAESRFRPADDALRHNVTAAVLGSIVSGALAVARMGGVRLPRPRDYFAGLESNFSISMGNVRTRTPVA